MELIFHIAIILFAGIFMGRLVKFLKLPNVTGYLIAGLLLGPYVFKVLSLETVQSMEVVSDVALSFIAFSIGSEFKLSYFKRVGLAPVVIAIFEAMVAVLLVTGGLLAAGQEPAFSIVLGSIAAATAPAATIMVVKQYKAKGPVTETLMSVVAMDDAVALIAFGFAVAIARAIAPVGGEATSVLSSFLSPILELGLSVVIGGVIGLVMTIPYRWFKKDGNRIILTTGFIFITYALASMAGASPLLTCMIMGAVFVNIFQDSDSVMNLTDYITPPIFLMFFVVSGAELDITILPKIGLCGIIYVVLRVAGKILGAFLGAKISHAPPTVQKFLGPTLLPQAGVAIGLTLVAAEVVPQYAAVIRAVVLCGTLIYEIIGPVVTKFTLQKAGEIQPAVKKS